MVLAVRACRAERDHGLRCSIPAALVGDVFSCNGHAHLVHNKNARFCEG